MLKASAFFLDVGSSWMDLIGNWISSPWLRSSCSSFFVRVPTYAKEKERERSHRTKHVRTHLQNSYASKPTPLQHQLATMSEAKSVPKGLKDQEVEKGSVKMT